MKVCFDCYKGYGRGIQTVTSYLKRYAPPDIEFVSFEEADVYLTHGIGNPLRDLDRNEYNRNLWERVHKKPFVVLLHCVDSEGGAVYNPFFDYCLENARMIYTPLPVERYCALPGTVVKGPWGVRDDIFRRINKEGQRPFRITATGYVAATEAIEEIYIACRELKVHMCHLGHNFNFGVFYHHKENLTDEEVNRIFNQSVYVSALRREEGFEVPALEGVLAGARPICFDNPHYKWFSDFAVYIPETSFTNTVESLIRVLSKDPEPISDELIESVKSRFSWKVVAERFWQAFKEKLGA